ncbi:MAG: Uncharacterized protein XD54_0159 [Thermococcus sibiricus]|uniref:Uncharacterized protein n=2 Tax=Thermococcus sibiricus TaxID=172049 RepID=C6A307_THESM|nr:hypothetical protein TSIB_0944 [Thermococcus sibiricus MM 739]KUK18599.1 MAG: Uncharacterized protein XD54_0159 [Thermococcus sibiricus]KUK29391.1 MAG: Uncharacterized protein XD61_0037 [Thermococcus sp. 40_45]
MNNVKRFISLILILIIAVSVSACVSKESSTPSTSPPPASTPVTIDESTSTSSTSSETTTTETTSINKADIIETIEKVEKYEFAAQYSAIPEKDIQVTSKGGFDYSKEEAFWEIISKSGDFVTYSNETVWDDSIYYSALVKQNNRVVQKGEATLTLDEYLEKVLKGRTEIATSEKFKQQLFKGPDPTRNPLYYIRDILSNADSFTASQEGDNYLLTFTFTKEEQITLNSVQKVVKIQGTGKLWIRGDKLPIKGEIEITKATSYAGLEESTTTSNAEITFEIMYEYQPPEWVTKITK